MKSQRSRVLAIIALAVLPLVAFVGARIWLEYKEDKAAVVEERLARARTTAFAVHVFIDNHVTTASSIALHPALTSGRVTRDLQAFLAAVARQNPDWAGIGVVGPDGYSVAGTRGGPRIYLGDRPYLKEALSSGRPVVSSALLGRRTGKPTIVIAAPFDLARGGRGALVAPLPTEGFGAELIAKVGLPSAEIAVIDREGQVFIHSDPARAARLTSVREAPAAAAALRGQSGSLVRAVDGAQRLIVYAPVPEYGWAILLSEPVRSAFAAARAEALERAAWLAGVLLLVAAIAWGLGGRLSHLYQRAVDARAEADAARAELERALRGRDEFLAAASHDLRNPLAAIRASVDFVQASVERSGAVSGERLAAAMRHIDAACRRMTGQIDAFLDIARLQLGAPLELELAPLDLVPLVAQLVEECREMSPRHSVSLDAPEELQLRADASRLQRAIANLLHNAVKYSPQGGPVEVRVSRSADGTRAEIAVADQGIGIPGADLERIFQRFERGANVVGRIAGTGVGLAGARQIVEQHGGSIAVASVLGQGSVFTVTLPAGVPVGTGLANPARPSCLT